MQENQDIFRNDIFSGAIAPAHSTKFNLGGTKLPTNQDIYFLSKWHELHDRYSTARLFLRKAQDDLGDYWFKPNDDAKIQEAFSLVFKGELFETALMNYNILVDLSWTLTYVSAEYVLYSFDKDGNVLNASDVCGLHPIDEAYELLRKTENGVFTPHAEGNPFNYIKKMRPEFSEAIDTIIEFWRAFSNSNIRNLYNYIKHKGKPRYQEIERLHGSRFMRIIIGKDEVPSDIRDVQMIVSLEDSIRELVEFDNDQLYPYIEKLIVKLKDAVNPSPMVL